MDPDYRFPGFGLIYGAYGALGSPWSPARYAPHQRAFHFKRPPRKKVSSHRNDPKRSARFAQKRGARR